MIHIPFPSFRVPRSASSVFLHFSTVVAKPAYQILVGPESLFQPLDRMLASIAFQMVSTTSRSLQRLDSAPNTPGSRYLSMEQVRTRWPHSRTTNKNRTPHTPTKTPRTCLNSSAGADHL